MSFKYGAADCLSDIVENAERVSGYVVGMDRAGFKQAGVRRDAVERCLERVCEAVHRLGTRADNLMPGQPWSAIRGLGNRLRHAYDRIDADIIWDAALISLPRLATAAEAALHRLADDEADQAERSDP